MEVHVESMESKWNLRIITKIGNISWNPPGVHGIMWNMWSPPGIYGGG
jgi:hypothetical protein